MWMQEEVRWPAKKPSRVCSTSLILIFVPVGTSLQGTMELGRMGNTCTAQIPGAPSKTVSVATISPLTVNTRLSAGFITPDKLI